jgi:hypothetical protein
MAARSQEDSPMTTRLVAGVAYMLAVAGLSGSAETGTVPRYLFEPGQELNYRTANSSQEQG